ncbi:MAG: DUF1489 domain-containing protein [Hyphomicrobiales bacterium]|nr:DUF1489 domain-containing protein [Hyphomicrobiales bacterium]MBV8427107.1 DUF1489 domain-containing protein [Hyphomicrobiales bacterium]MBV8765520.1 DUF1489 domain-containing protein [Hyphomicrobiales bacterium]MBV9431024.1 DUF1489 domain-containing protein [Hyphomicrobiales bacterium]MBV9738191.1 DUF1489 domain-containing protein [Hyphomicrobiales bacterium]
MPPLHLIKLCVGVETISELEEWVDRKLRERGEHFHVTRMVPKRVEELLAGGSLYWVIKGQIACRQKLIGITSFTDREGIGRCKLALEPIVKPVTPRPYRAFQGWRYLPPKDAPRDLGRRGKGLGAMPERMRRELAELGLI